MDEKLSKQLIRQLKFLNFFIGLFGVLILAAIAVIGFMLFQVITFTQTAANNISDFRQETAGKLDVREQACGDETLGAFLRNNSNVCN